MLNWLKWVFARQEMETLERYRVNITHAQRWLGEFPDACDALDYVHVESEQTSAMSISLLRDKMRNRRVATQAAEERK
jgi:hypothetical protein